MGSISNGIAERMRQIRRNMEFLSMQRGRHFLMKMRGLWPTRTTRMRQTAPSDASMRALDMRDHYDFSKSKKNPYAKKLKKQITIRLDEDTIAYFKALAEQKGIPYQSLINLYLRDCAERSRDLKIKWA